VWLRASRVLYVESDGNGASMPGPQYTDGVPPMRGPLPLVSFDSTLSERYRLGRPIQQVDVANDASLTPEQKANFLRHEIGSYIAVPMVKSGGIVARLGVHHRAPHVWTDEEMWLVQETAERLWAALERAHAQGALRQSEARLRALVTASSNVIYRMSGDWKEMLSLEGQGFLADTAEASAAWMADYLYPEDQPLIAAAVQRALETRSIFELEHRVRRADGSVGWTLSRAVPLFDEAGNITEWFGAASDVTERVLAKEAVAADLRATQLLQGLGARFVSDRAGIQVLYDEINDIARKLTNADAGTVQILDAATQELVLSSTHGFPADTQVRFGRVAAVSATSCGVALQSGARMVLDFDDPALADPKGDLRWHVAAGYLSAQSTPLIARTGRAIGMVSTHWRAHHRPTEHELRFLDLLARQAADLIEQWQAREELRESEARLAAELADTRQLQRISSQLLLQDDTQSLYAQIVEAAQGLMKADAASIQMLEAGTQELRMLAGSGVDPAGAEFWVRVTTQSSSSCGESLRTGRRCIIPDVEKWDFAASSQDLEHFRRNGLRALQSTPLISRSGQMVGMISTHWREPQTPSEHELRLLDVLARQAADLIERQAAGDKLRSSEEKYRSLFESIDEGFCLIDVLFDGSNQPVDYRFIEANPAFEKHTGLRDVLGQTMRQLAPDHDDHWFQIYGRIALTGNAERFELPAEALGRFYDVYAFRVGEAAQRRVAILFDDITGRKLTEDILRQEADIDAYRVALNDALASLTEPMEVQAVAARVLGMHLQTARAVYFEVEHQPDSDYYILRGDYHSQGTPGHAGRYRADDFGATLYEEMRAGRTLVVNDVATEPKLTQAEIKAHADVHVAAYICVPLLKDGRHAAFICVDQAEPRIWTQAEIAVVEETAERAWAAVESARYEQTLRQSEEKQAFLLALSDTLRPLATPEEIMDTAVGMLGRQLHVTQVGYAETDDGQTYLDVLADWTEEGRLSTVGQHPIPAHHVEAITSYQAGKPWVVEDVEIDSRQAVRDAAHVYIGVGARATLNVPLVKDGRWVAMLYATSTTPRRWTPGEIELSREVAERTWAALELGRAQQALREAKDAAELANRSKDHFLAVLSHELRTPLTPVLMTVDALQHDATLSPALREDLAMMKRNIQLETKLIDDLLDISRITSGKLVLHLSAVDLNDVVRNVCRLCNPLVRERGMELHTRLARSAGVINADSARVQQVLWNVLMNAMKFTPAGGSITVTTAWIDAGRCEVRIQDTGAGIAPEVLPHIFNAFEQGGAGVTRQFGGLGLGLAICKALVELHQGAIRAESAGAGHGATIVIELPGRVMTATAKIRLAAPAAKVEAGHLRVLMVEDHPDTERVLGALLRRAGFSVTTAPNVAKATTTAREQAFDILVSDLGLPDGTGYDVMRTVHSILGIPGIAMSGFGMEEDIRRSRDAGFSEHLVKPIDVGELIATIQRVAAKHVGSPG